MELLDDLYDTLPIWIKFRSIKKMYQIDKAVARIASTLGTSLNGHFTYANDDQVDVHLVIVVRVTTRKHILYDRYLYGIYRYLLFIIHW